MSAHEAAVRLRESMDWLVDDEMFADLRVHGNSGWSLRVLTVSALLWAVSAEAGLVERFHQALVMVTAWFRRGLGALTYQGFIKALVRWTETLQPRLRAHWRQRLEALGVARAASRLAVVRRGRHAGRGPEPMRPPIVRFRRRVGAGRHNGLPGSLLSRNSGYRWCGKSAWA